MTKPLQLERLEPREIFRADRLGAGSGYEEVFALQFNGHEVKLTRGEANALCHWLREALGHWPAPVGVEELTQALKECPHSQVLPGSMARWLIQRLQWVK